MHIGIVLHPPGCYAGVCQDSVVPVAADGAARRRRRRRPVTSRDTATAGFALSGERALENADVNARLKLSVDLPGETAHSRRCCDCGRAARFHHRPLHAWAVEESVGRLRVCHFAFSGLTDAGAVLVGALVGQDLLDTLVVPFGENSLHLGGSQLVIARPRLVAAQGGDPAEDRGAVLVLALVGVDLGEVDLGERGSLAVISSAVRLSYRGIARSSAPATAPLT